MVLLYFKYVQSFLIPAEEPIHKIDWVEKPRSSPMEDQQNGEKLFNTKIGLINPKSRTLHRKLQIHNFQIGPPSRQEAFVQAALCNAAWDARKQVAEMNIIQL